LLVLDHADKFDARFLARAASAAEEGRAEISGRKGRLIGCPIWLMAAVTTDHSCPAVCKKQLKAMEPIGKACDLHVEAPTVPSREMTGTRPGTETARIREVVIRAREVQRVRGSLNATDPNLGASVASSLSDSSKLLMRRATSELGLNGRATDRIMRIARTIADMDGSDNVAELHLAEAIQYRLLDRAPWA